MNSQIATVAIASCLLLASSSLAADTAVLSLPASCASFCNAECTVSDTACRVVPGLGAVCDANLAACTALCASSCTCFDGCVSRCQENGAACNSEGTFQDAALCGVTEAQCLSTCPVSCGFQTGSSLFNSLLGLYQ